MHSRKHPRLCLKHADFSSELLFKSPEPFSNLVVDDTKVRLQRFFTVSWVLELERGDLIHKVTHPAQTIIHDTCRGTATCRANMVVFHRSWTVKPTDMKARNNLDSKSSTLFLVSQYKINLASSPNCGDKAYTSPLFSARHAQPGIY